MGEEEAGERQEGRGEGGEGAICKMWTMQSREHPTPSNVEKLVEKTHVGLW